MHDPFPLHPPAGVAKLITPYAKKLGLQTLPYHFHEVLFAFSLYHLTHTRLAPFLSRRLIPGVYANFNPRTKLNWDVHIVSFVQSTLICTLALWVIFKDEERGSMGGSDKWAERIWGYTGAGGMIQGFAGGYFLWDLLITLQNVSAFGAGMLAHAVSALFVFSLGFRPFLNYYGPTFLLYELSSPFLNIHWFCDKLNLTGSNIQLYNGILLLATFFGCRLCWGTYQSIQVYRDCYNALKLGVYNPSAPELEKMGQHTDDAEIMRFAAGQNTPLWLLGSYLASNLTLNGLNWYWFAKMIETIRKRFDPPFGTRGTQKHEKEHVLVEGIDVETDSDPEAKTSGAQANGDITMGRGIEVDGNEERKTVEVQKKEIRNRRRG